jgi:zinc transport system substrate-binding protein
LFEESRFMKRFVFGLGVFLYLSAFKWVGPCDADSISVFVSIAPQKYFVERIAGSLVQVSVLVGPSDNPHNFEPKPQQMLALARTQLYFALGMTFEKVWLKKIAAANPRLLIVHTETGIEKIPMVGHPLHGAGQNPHHEREPNHDLGTGFGNHGDGGEHLGIRDPHIWLSPPLVMLQARNILQALLAIDPSHRAAYEANYRKFIMDLVDLDAEIREILWGKKEGTEFLVFHPSWGYFARAYGLKQVPAEIEGKEPKPGDLKKLIRHARDKGIRVVFVQPQFSTRSAELIAEALEGHITYADPLAEDWAQNLRHVASRFKAALK